METVRDRRKIEGDQFNGFTNGVPDGYRTCRVCLRYTPIKDCVTKNTNKKGIRIRKKITGHFQYAICPACDAHLEAEIVKHQKKYERYLKSTGKKGPK